MKNQIARLPSFIIIGAMKSATTTLYEQLLLQPGIFLPSLKEPNYFSDDEQYSKGLDWYTGLFAEAQEDELIGEASTHYTKLPDYPRTLTRMCQLLPQLKLIYVIRHPVDRLISHYIHQWSQGVISDDIDSAIGSHPELVEYSRYSYQLEPFLSAYGRSSIKLVFFESIQENPQLVLEDVCRFIGYKKKPFWNEGLAPSNVSRDRIRKFPLYNFLVESPLASFLRRTFVPKSLREKIKHNLQMSERPRLNESSQARLIEIFDRDLALLSGWLGEKIDCENFKFIARNHSNSLKQ